MKVLVQEHDAPVRALIRTMLTRPGTSVLAVRDPWEAAVMAEREAPDVVLLSAADVYYCGRDVPAVLAAMSPRTPTLLVGESEPRGGRAPRLPVDGYLAFPFDVAQLAAAIGSVLAHSREPLLAEV